MNVRVNEAIQLPVFVIMHGLNHMQVTIRMG